MQARLIAVAITLCLSVQSVLAEGFSHDRWDMLLKRHVVVSQQGSASVVDYAGVKRDVAILQQYLQSLSEVTAEQFDSFNKDQQLAFLINAYNAWTVDLILTKWPELKSIKDLGGFFSSPWSNEFIPLFGEQRSLDDIEHKLIRGSGRYRDPRIHFAVNCASIGCPALRAQAYTGELLDRQLDEQTHLFLSDKTRNQWRDDVLTLSPIFKWYREDFEKGWRGYTTLQAFISAYSKALNLTPQVVAQLQAGSVDIEFSSYNWQLNAL